MQCQLLLQLISKKHYHINLGSKKVIAPICNMYDNNKLLLSLIQIQTSTIFIHFIHLFVTLSKILILIHSYFNLILNSSLANTV